MQTPQELSKAKTFLKSYRIPKREQLKSIVLVPPKNNDNLIRQPQRSRTTYKYRTSSATRRMPRQQRSRSPLRSQFSQSRENSTPPQQGQQNSTKVPSTTTRPCFPTPFPDQIVLSPQAVWPMLQTKVYLVSVETQTEGMKSEKEQKSMSTQTDKSLLAHYPRIRQRRRWRKCPRCNIKHQGRPCTQKREADRSDTISELSMEIQKNITFETENFEELQSTLDEDLELDLEIHLSDEELQNFEALL